MIFYHWISIWWRLFFEGSAVASVKIADFSGEGSLYPVPPVESL